MKKLLCLFLVSIAVSSALHAQTDEYVVLDRRADEFDRWQERVDYTYGTIAIAKETTVPMYVLEEQRTRSHFGYGGLLIANALAFETGKSFDEILALKSSGYGWGRIARENNVDLGRIVSRLDRIEGEFRNAANTDENPSAKINVKEKVKEAKSRHTSDKPTRSQGQSKVKVKTRGKVKEKHK
jgi:Sec-independent protein translocase protein TatA